MSKAPCIAACMLMTDRGTDLELDDSMRFLYVYTWIPHTASITSLSQHTYSPYNWLWQSRPWPRPDQPGYEPELVNLPFWSRWSVRFPLSLFLDLSPPPRPSWVYALDLSILSLASHLVHLVVLLFQSLEVSTTSLGTVRQSSRAEAADFRWRPTSWNAFARPLTEKTRRRTRCHRYSLTLSGSIYLLAIQSCCPSRLVSVTCLYSELHASFIWHRAKILSSSPFSHLQRRLKPKCSFTSKG